MARISCIERDSRIRDGETVVNHEFGKLQKISVR
jgi:hypothetical protein